MGKKGQVQNRFVLLVGFAVLLTASLASVNAAPLDIGIEQRDWIDKGLDRFYDVIGASKGVSIPIAGDIGVRVGQPYSPEERSYFMAAVVGLSVLGVLILCCCCCCCLYCKRRSEPSPVYVAPPNANNYYTGAGTSNI